MKAAQTKAQRRTVRQARTRRLAEQRRVEMGEADKPTRATYAPIKHDSDGLEWLRHKGRLTFTQFQAGRQYGALYRAASVEGSQPLPSALGLPEVRGNGGKFPETNYETATWIIDAREKLEAARGAVNYHAGKIAVLDVICGRGWLPTEVTKIQRETDAIENTLRLCLDDLGDHFGVRRTHSPKVLHK